MDLIDEYLALFRIVADSPHKEKLVAGVSREKMEKAIAAHKSASEKKDWVDRFVALMNIGCGEVMMEELEQGARMEELEKEFHAAVRAHDLTRIERLEKAIRAERKRQSQQMPLSDVERRVLRIHEYLHFREGRPPADADLHHRFCEEYPNLQHDLKTISRARVRLGLPVTKGKRGPKPK